MSAHETALGSSHHWTADSARVMAVALAALGRVEEADAVRMRYPIDQAG